MTGVFILLAIIVAYWFGKVVGRNEGARMAADAIATKLGLTDQLHEKTWPEVQREQSPSQ